MRWWFESVWVVAVWRRGDASSASSEDEDGDLWVPRLERCFCRESEARRLEVK